MEREREGGEGETLYHFGGLSVQTIIRDNRVEPIDSKPF